MIGKSHFWRGRCDSFVTIFLNLLKVIFEQGSLNLRLIILVVHLIYLISTINMTAKCRELNEKLNFANKICKTFKMHIKTKQLIKTSSMKNECNVNKRTTIKV